MHSSAKSCEGLSNEVPPIRKEIIDICILGDFVWMDVGGNNAVPIVVLAMAKYEVEIEVAGNGTDFYVIIENGTRIMDIVHGRWDIADEVCRLLNEADKQGQFVLKEATR